MLGIATAAALIVVAAGTVHADDAEALWNKSCAPCHGKDFKGETKAGAKMGVKDLTADDVRAGFDRDRMIKSTTEGVLNADTGKAKMKPYGEKLSAEQIAALVDLIIGLK